MRVREEGPRRHGTDDAATLLVLAGRPGVGKTTLARGLVRATGACFLRIDALETALARSGADAGAEGYAIAHAVAASNLQLGNDVVVDAVNAVPEARAGWVGTACASGARLVMIEVVLPDADEHRRRVASRRPDIPGHRVPSWQEVETQPGVAWDEARDGHRHVIDATDADAAITRALRLLAPAGDRRVPLDTLIERRRLLEVDAQRLRSDVDAVIDPVLVTMNVAVADRLRHRDRRGAPTTEQILAAREIDRR